MKNKLKLQTNLNNSNMKSMKFMLSAMLMTMSLGAFAQYDDELDATVAEEEAPEVTVPATPVDKKFFHRVTLGYQGTNVKTTNYGETLSPEDLEYGSPGHRNYFLSGLSIGWLGDLRIDKKLPLYLELGANFTYHTGRSKYDFLKQDGFLDEVCHYRIQAFSMTIPVSISYHMKNFVNIEGLTFAPFAGVNARFNLVANRWESATVLNTAEPYTIHTHGSLMSDVLNGGVADAKPHTGKLIQAGIQVGATVYYKHYSASAAYMYDLTPFASHVSANELTYDETENGGKVPNIGTGCNYKVKTSHNFAVTLGYIF